MSADVWSAGDHLVQDHVPPECSLLPSPVMANVLPSFPSIDFHPRPANHALGFGFGLGGSVVAAPAWPSAIPSSAFHQLSSSFNQPSPIRVQKRRHEDDEQALSRDHSMDRSPTPDERPKRGAPKRAKVSPSAESGSKEEDGSKENKAPSGTDENDVDIGVLLGKRFGRVS